MAKELQSDDVLAISSTHQPISLIMTHLSIQIVDVLVTEADKEPYEGYQEQRCTPGGVGSTGHRV